jgi:hypothetical protein
MGRESADRADHVRRIAAMAPQANLAKIPAGSPSVSEIHETMLSRLGLCPCLWQIQPVLAFFMAAKLLCEDSDLCDATFVRNDIKIVVSPLKTFGNQLATDVINAKYDGCNRHDRLIRVPHNQP